MLGSCCDNDRTLGKAYEKRSWEDAVDVEFDADGVWIAEVVEALIPVRTVSICVMIMAPTSPGAAPVPPEAFGLQKTPLKDRYLLM